MYQEGEPIDGIYFCVGGSIGYVLPSFNNVIYICISKGYEFGLTDILGSTEDFEYS